MKNVNKQLQGKNLLKDSTPTRIYRDSKTSVINAIDMMSNELISVSSTLEQNERQLQDLDQEFRRIQAAWRQIHNRKSAAGTISNESKRTYEELSCRSEAIKPNEESVQLRDHLVQIRSQIADIEIRLESFPVSNPHMSEVESLKRRAMEIRYQTYERVQANPSQHLQEQLAREAEAVEHAETTTSLEKKQDEIGRVSEDLASLKLLSAPRLEADSETKSSTIK